MEATDHPSLLLRLVKAGWLHGDLTRRITPPCPLSMSDGQVQHREQAETLARSLAGRALKIKMKSKKRAVFKIMELPGKNILHDLLCGKYLFPLFVRALYHAQNHSPH